MADQGVLIEKNTAKWLVRQGRRVEGLPVDVTGDLGPGPVAAREIIHAKLTSKDGYKYAWTEVRPGDSGWVTVTDGRTGTTTDKFAFDKSMATGSFAVDEVVAIRRVAWETTTDNFIPAWVILGGAGSGLPTPTFTGMGLYVVAHGVWGVDFLRAVSPVI